MTTTALITAVAFALCCVRYFLNRRSILLTNIAIGLTGIYDLLRLAGVENSGIYFGMLAILSSLLQIAGVGLPAALRWAIALSISVVAIFYFGEAAAPLMLASFVIARFSESAKNVNHLRFGMLITHFIWIYYGFIYESHLIIMTQAIQIVVIMGIFLYQYCKSLTMSKVAT